MATYNRLKKTQKEALLSWIAEGLDSAEINERAGNFAPPFVVSKQVVNKYRQTRAIDLAAIQAAGEYDALTEGLARKEERVKLLQQLAALMARDLFGGFLWTDDAKALGQGPTMQIMEYEVFNAAEVQQLRGVLDDIAKEVGHRKQTAELSGPNGGKIEVKTTHDVSAELAAEALRILAAASADEDTAATTGDS